MYTHPGHPAESLFLLLHPAGNQDEIKTEPGSCVRSWPSQCCKKGILVHLERHLKDSLKKHFEKKSFFFPPECSDSKSVIFPGISGNSTSPARLWLFGFLSQMGQGVPEWREQRPGCPGGIPVLCPVCSHVSQTFLGFPARNSTEIGECSFIPKGFSTEQAAQGINPWNGSKSGLVEVFGGSGLFQPP